MKHLSEKKLKEEEYAQNAAKNKKNENSSYEYAHKQG